ncbi:unnamed protein product [marine sediment metagenome]|uniref:Uncharacterized protein n=1 Tax=marine sediment metagenome TaxID=412755 RepID=X0XFY5_9ZZZZ
MLASFGTTGEQAQPLIGSAQDVVSEQKTEFGFERQITKETGASNVQQSLARGKSIASQYKFNAITSGASSIANMISAYRAG